MIVMDLLADAPVGRIDELSFGNADDVDRIGNEVGLAAVTGGRLFQAGAVGHKGHGVARDAQRIEVPGLKCISVMDKDGHHAA